jgi:hypothetical protein
MRFDPTLDVSAIEAAARESTLPLKLLDLGSEEAPAAYRHKLLICRADQHVAWRGDALPAKVAELVALMRGLGRPA